MQLNQNNYICPIYHRDFNGELFATQEFHLAVYCILLNQGRDTRITSTSMTDTWKLKTANLGSKRDPSPQVSIRPMFILADH